LASDVSGVCSKSRLLNISVVSILPVVVDVNSVLTVELSAFES